MERELEKLHAIIKELKTRFYERDDLIEGAVCALLTSNHVIIIGPPGTAKSQLANELCSRITGTMYFQWLLTKFSTPEEIFGSVSLKGLQNDEYKRVTANKLPEAHIAFLDEVFKSSSSILNSILTVINERVYFNGTEKIDTPLITLFGASNELPTDEDELDALYDRFLVRFVVGYIEEDFRFLKMIQHSGDNADAAQISMQELFKLQQKVTETRIPQAVYKILLRIRAELNAKGIILSDRRYKSSVSLIRAKAFINGRESANEDDVGILENVLWKDPSEIPDIKNTIHSVLFGYREQLKELYIQAKEIEAYSKQKWEDEETKIKANIEAQTKLKMLINKVDGLSDELSERGISTTEVSEIKSQIEEVQKEILNSLVDPQQAVI
ncbi:MAG: AAA domain-containing protein [Candidatus Dadabacteria bacterium]|nr:AAA domain-containing protein [Candidatus Dadabacteria bacterium]NIS07353.1 AAA domain-containing protein [Candidatus Dadabacteria bacterium]NIV41297.1 AAA domain-containing protein [Candidatus Dadabacteria bacterium]NIX14532.1 AAA domain-containing protein [Candidatus Dadabacteria bacterium]NIY20990.1 AAA domain-containing protein [Candidatus Dadabacteria bacterium]